MNYEFVGQFNIESGKIMVSDPLCSFDSRYKFEHKAKNGVWNAYVVRSDYRIKRLIAVHSDYGLQSRCNRETGVAVDSAQMSIVDYEHFRKNEDILDINDCWEGITDNLENYKWYAHCCKITISDKQCGIIKPGFGVVSTSGYGDGLYPARYKLNKNGEVVKVDIMFF